ncbi:MAG: ABC transporter permease, partial [Butyricicoccus sp.]|nr:ABC transporter permease [Butyricicoccus sp.]
TGTIVGTIIGTLIVGVLNNGLDLMLVDAYTQQILKGLIIIAAVIFDQMKNKR